MPAEISDAGEALLDLMPYYYAEDPAARTVIDAVARELARLEEFLNLVQRQWFPQHAADDYGQLGLREEQLGIPVEPTALSLEQRRQIVAAYEKARLSGSGEDWIVLLSIALGATVWDHDENDPEGYDLRITIPYEEGGFTTGQVEALADVVTPAHLNLALTYDEGFIIGVNRLGDSM